MGLEIDRPIILGLSAVPGQGSTRPAAVACRGLTRQRQFPLNFREIPVPPGRWGVRDSSCSISCCTSSFSKCRSSWNKLAVFFEQFLFQVRGEEFFLLNFSSSLRMLSRGRNIWSGPTAAGRSGPTRSARPGRAELDFGLGQGSGFIATSPSTRSNGLQEIVQPLTLFFQDTSGCIHPVRHVRG